MDPGGLSPTLRNTPGTGGAGTTDDEEEELEEARRLARRDFETGNIPPSIKRDVERMALFRRKKHDAYIQTARDLLAVEFTPQRTTQRRSEPGEGALGRNPTIIVNGAIKTWIDKEGAESAVQVGDFLRKVSLTPGSAQVKLTQAIERSEGSALSFEDYVGRTGTWFDIVRKVMTNVDPTYMRNLEMDLRQPLTRKLSRVSVVRDYKTLKGDVQKMFRVYRWLVEEVLRGEPHELGTAQGVETMCIVNSLPHDIRDSVTDLRQGDFTDRTAVENSIRHAINKYTESLHDARMAATRDDAARGDQMTRVEDPWRDHTTPLEDAVWGAVVRYMDSNGPRIQDHPGMGTSNRRTETYFDRGRTDPLLSRRREYIPDGRRYYSDEREVGEEDRGRSVKRSREE